MKEMLAHINLECVNSARLICVNSSSSNFLLKTFLSSTETVMVNKAKDDLPEGIFSNLDNLLS